MKIAFLFNARKIADGLVNEFGLIPPGLLPVRNQYLIEHQIEWLETQKYDEIYIVTTNDMVGLFEGITSREFIKVVPDGSSLFDNVSKMLEFANGYRNCARVALHWGDILVTTDVQDEVGVGVTTPNFDREWLYVDEEKIFSGLMIIDDIAEYHQYENLNEFISDFALTKNFYINVDDFGSAFSYYNNYFNNSSARAFNTVQVTKKYVVKSSNDKQKINSELNWFSNLPSRLNYFVPKTMPSGSDGMYYIERLPMVSLNNHFVYGNQKLHFWDQVSMALKDWLDESEAAAQEQPSVSRDIYGDINYNLFVKKTIQRIHTFFKSDNCKTILEKTRELDDVQIILEDALQRVVKYFGEEDINFAQPYIMHGDLCFSNILFDSRTHSIRLIDPKGFSSNFDAQFCGSRLYDEAKLAHSILGFYDIIIAKKCGIADDTKIIFPSKYYGKGQDVYEKFVENNIFKYSLRDHSYGQLALFLSMLPLHNDSIERQKLFILNIRRLVENLQ